MVEFALDPARRRAQTAAGMAALSMVLLASCGGGGSSPSPPPPPTASFSYPAPPAYVVGAAIAQLTPAVHGSLNSFYCPDLPPGLVVDSATGVISGRPTVPSASSNYMISAADASGQVISALVNMTVNLLRPGVISYQAAAFTFTAGTPANTLTPAAGSRIGAWSIAPQLPPGLSFSASDGSISGNPTAASPPTPYTVTAQGPTGPLSVTITLEVDSDVLVDLGHANTIQTLQFDGSTVLSEDVNGRWVLWNYGTGAMIASGDAGYGDAFCNGCGVLSAPPGLPGALLAGPTMVIHTHTGLEARSAATGALTANISATLDWWSLATDGSYVVGGNNTGVNVWSPTGQLIISRAGNYEGALAFASPGAVRIGNGAAGANIVETISIPSGADVTSPTFTGQFASWFLDGSGFLSMGPGSGTSAITLLLYSNGAVLEGSIATPVITNTYPFFGTWVQGPWLWTFSGMTLSVYARNSLTTPVATYSFADGNDLLATFASGTTIGVRDDSSGKFSVIDLSGAAPVKVDYAPPFGGAEGVSAYAATSASQWISGWISGVLLDGASLPGTPRFLDYGRAYSVSGNANRIAIATASGRILYFNAVTLAQEGTIQFSTDQPVAESSVAQATLSSDGSTLAFLAPGGVSVNTYALPSGSLLYSGSYPSSAGLSPMSISSSGSGSGTVLGVTALNQTLPSPTFTQSVGATTGGASVFSQSLLSIDGWPPPLRLSPDGTQIATSAWGNPANGSVPLPMQTNLVTSTGVARTLSGWPVGWIDDTRLLVNNYVAPGAPGTVYGGCTVYDLSGTPTGTCALPEVTGFQTLNSDTLYSLLQPAMASVSTGNVSWMSADPLPYLVSISNPLNLVYHVGPFFTALAGNHVVLVSDSRVVVQSY